jgi:hypothetical protein
MKKRLLYVCPHLSTGGLPQYVYKQIENFKDEFEIQVVEINNVGGDAFVVQKNRIKSTVPLHTLGVDKSDILSVIEVFSPHIIHFQEIPQFELSDDILDKIFDNSRDYYIITSTHGSYTEPTQIKYHPDRYVLVSEWSRRKFEVTGVDTQIWEYPIEDYVFDKSASKKQLGFEDDWKHILNVGLFAPGKNQKEIFDIAKELGEYKIKFHFVGNQAMNFENYWKPLMETKPDNCIVWGERNDVDTFYAASDAFYFSSILELNPLSIKEALSYKLPSLFRKLDTYLDTYDNNKLVTYIDDDLNKNKNKLLNAIGLSYNVSNSVDVKDDTISIILSHADTEYRKSLLTECITSVDTQTIISSHYPIDSETQQLSDWSIYEKDNPLLFKEDYKKYNINYSYWYIDKAGVKQFKDFDFEHSYAVYRLMQNALRFAKNLGKTYAHMINYDYTTNTEILKSHRNYLTNGNDYVFYEYDENAYSSGFFSGKIDNLLTYFNKYNSFEEFYTASDVGIIIFENKIYNYFKNQKAVKELDFKKLKNEMKVNQEGLLEFSKDWNKK